MTRSNKSKTLEQLVKYSDNKNSNYYNFADGVDIEDIEIDRYVKEVVDSLMSSNKCTTASYGSGNTLVLGFYDPQEKIINVIVTKNYKECSIYLDEEPVINLEKIRIEKNKLTNKWNLKYKVDHDG